MAGALLCSIFCWSGAAATPAGALTLEEAIARALMNSGQVVAAAEAAGAARLDARGASLARLPSITLGLEAVRSDHPVQVFSGLLGQEQFAEENFGSVDFETGRFDLSPLNRPDPHTNLRASVLVRQTLWSGGFVTGRLDAARAGAAAHTAQADRTRERIALDTETVYRNALLADEALRVLRESLDVAERHAARVGRLRDEGLALESDHLALTAHLEEVRARLAGAVADSIETRSALGLLMGADEPIDTPLIDPNRPAAGPAPSLADGIETATSRRDVEAAEAARRAAGAMKKMTLAQALPALEAGAGAEHNSETFFGEGGNQWMVMVGARLQLDPGVVHRVRAAAARERAAGESAALARDAARHEVRVAWSRWHAARGREHALAAAAAAAREAFRLIERRHEEGLATVLDLTTSQNTLTRTLLEAAAARHQADTALAGFRFAAGTLLDQEDR